MTGLVAAEAKALEDKANDAARLLEALANPRRLMILCQLVEGERSVGDLARTVGLKQAALSQHLARLRAQKLVTTRRVSQMIYYSLASEAAVAVIGTLVDIYCKPDGPPHAE